MDRHLKYTEEEIEEIESENLRLERENSSFRLYIVAQFMIISILFMIIFL